MLKGFGILNVESLTGCVYLYLYFLHLCLC